MFSVLLENKQCLLILLISESYWDPLGVHSSPSRSSRSSREKLCICKASGALAMKAGTVQVQATDSDTTGGCWRMVEPPGPRIEGVIGEETYLFTGSAPAKLLEDVDSPPASTYVAHQLVDVHLQLAVLLEKHSFPFLNELNQSFPLLLGIVYCFLFRSFRCIPLSFALLDPFNP